ncbi:site-specific DNA-methyltransferase (adenine-specific) [Methanolinea mesophila]|uniref:DNA-methyltransferase n=1 Tax=Methanolinea mesophila TaxID=547055 RepID=UPI001AE8CB43|nr:site-specific DNA-methyltransferase [Methanolinea mesophila]MBP1927947.1 site-specific DNA-methyltransferase (adenine-specific) [Methanolinea mesophila]
MTLPVPYFSRDGFTLYHGDCIDILGHLPAGSVDLIFADPPYNLSNGGFTCKSGKRASVDKGPWDVSAGIKEDFSFHLAWIGACRRVLKDHGTIWISGTYHSAYACGFALQMLGFHILNDICWFKPNAPPNLSGRFFTASHESLIWARKSKDSPHYFNYSLMKSGEWEEDSMKRPGKQMRSVWSIPSPKGEEKRQGKHPTQKPCALLRRVLLACSREGDVVLDPFTGSSTTGIAAAVLGRTFIGIDSSVEYLDLSIRRYSDLGVLE